MKVVTYGIGGWCENCDPEAHGHPLNNIIFMGEEPDPEPTPEELARQSAIDKLKKLGLSEEEIESLLSVPGA